MQWIVLLTEADGGYLVALGSTDGFSLRLRVRVGNNRRAAVGRGPVPAIVMGKNHRAVVRGVSETLTLALRKGKSCASLRGTGPRATSLMRRKCIKQSTGLRGTGPRATDCYDISVGCEMNLRRLLKMRATSGRYDYGGSSQPVKWDDARLDDRGAAEAVCGEPADT